MYRRKKSLIHTVSESRRGWFEQDKYTDKLTDNWASIIGWDVFCDLLLGYWTIYLSVLKPCKANCDVYRETNPFIFLYLCPWANLVSHIYHTKPCIFMYLGKCDVLWWLIKRVLTLQFFVRPVVTVTVSIYWMLYFCI